MTQKIMDSFDLNSAIESIKSLGFKVIRPLTSRTCYTDTPPPEKLLKAAILDIETTGLNLEADKIIDLGIVIAYSNPNRAAIPIQTGQRFQSKPGSDSNPNRAVIPI